MGKDVLIDVNVAIEHGKPKGLKVGGDIAALCFRTSYLIPAAQSLASSSEANIKKLCITENGRSYMPK